MKYTDHPLALLATLTRGLFNMGGIHSATPDMARQYRLAASALYRELDRKTRDLGIDKAYQNSAACYLNDSREFDRLENLSASLLQVLNGEPAKVWDERDRAPLFYVACRLGKTDGIFQN